MLRKDKKGQEGMIELFDLRKSGEGYPIVLTTDRTLASDYNGSEFIGFGATFPKVLPAVLYRSLFAPAVPQKNGVARYGHCGSRKIEAALLNNGFDEDDVVIGHPDHLDKLIGPDTKALGITTHDPLGLGPASTTFSNFVKGEPYSSLYFKKLVDDPLLKKHNIQVIVGGPGTWQIDDKRIMEKYNVNSIVMGEGEATAPEIFEKVLNGEKIPKRVRGEVVPVENIPKIKGPTINGLVEISRGCGRGCSFCNPTLLNLRHRPVEDIVDEVKINLEGGNRTALLHAEDVLRYGSHDLTPKPHKLLSLLKHVKKHTDEITFSHVAFASAASSPELIAEISELLDIGTEKRPWFSAQVGLETGSKKLAKKHLEGKANPFDAKEWPTLVKKAFDIFDENHWVPCVTIIMGLPGETPDDVMATMELLDDLDDKEFLIVPLMFVPLGVTGDEDFFSRDDMKPEHWQLLARCIRKDFEMVPELIDDLTKMDHISSLKKYGYHTIRKYMEKRLESYVRDMERGLDPSRCY